MEVIQYILVTMKVNQRNLSDMYMYVCILVFNPSSQLERRHALFSLTTCPAIENTFTWSVYGQVMV